MPKKYYCDYCNKSFQDTPKARKRHFTGQSHLRQRKYYYETVMSKLIREYTSDIALIIVIVIIIIFSAKIPTIISKF